MSPRFLGRVLSLVLLLGAEAAHARRVVVLEFRHDKGNKLRAQVERALKRSGSVQVLDVRKYKIAAAKKKLKGVRAMSPAAVAAVSRSLGLNAAVAGSGGKALRIQILDQSGTEIWSKEIPLRRGQLSADNARRLVAAVAGAAAPPPKPTHAPPVATPSAPTAPEEKTAEVQEKQPAQAMPPLDVSPKAEATDDRERRQREELAEAHTTTEPQRDGDLELEVSKRRSHVGPKFFSAQVTGTTTWRTYCSRPGVSGCGQYNSLDPTQRPAGDTVDFKAEVPYVGFALAVEFFPLAKAENLTKGLGLLAGYDRGFSQTNVSVQTSSTTDVTRRQVYSSDQGISLLATYRYFFGLGEKSDPLVAYAGLRGGYMSRTFEVDQNAAAPLPGSHRHYATVGVEALYPFTKFLKLDASGGYFLGPKPSASEINDYGTSSSSKGWGLEAGASGDVWGPFGYVLQFKLSKYTDQFSGAGAKWQSGGIAEETYVNLFWGATAHF